MQPPKSAADLSGHPIGHRLLAPGQALARHAVLHDMECRLPDGSACPGLAARVRHFVERGVPYFAPHDAHYREWVARAASLWDELVAAGEPQRAAA